ncbi:MAG: hypothetical protein ACFFBD_07720 [Candidatus Hodarchaeota archaeon]
MIKFPPFFIKGVIVMIFFLNLILVSSFFFPNPINVLPTRYQFVILDQLKNDPTLFEGKEISFGEGVGAVLEVNATAKFVNASGILIFCPVTTPKLSKGDIFQVRGVSFLVSKGYVLAIEIYIYPPSLDYFSFLGVIIFASMFFYTFATNWRQLTFVPRRKEHA